MLQDKVVFDTNLIISAGISKDGNPAKVFELFLNDIIKNHTTNEIIEEIEEVLKRPKISKCINKEYKKFLIDNLKNKSINIKPTFNEKVVYEDKDDDKFINCALTANATIISGDKHLLKIRKYKNINILNPKEFLKEYSKRKIIN